MNPDIAPTTEGEAHAAVPATAASALKQLTFYFDFVSPYAYLAFAQLPRALQGLSYSVRYQPVLLGALLSHHGQKGPAEIPTKRDWMRRHVQWLADSQATPLQWPLTHPFNPLPLLRLAVACAAGEVGGLGGVEGLPNRHVCETIFRHVWNGGGEAVDAARLAALAAQLAPVRESTDAAVKAQLKAHTDDALARGVFGVPAFAVDGEVFWGLDALPMLRDCMARGAQ